MDDSWGYYFKILENSENGNLTILEQNLNRLLNNNSFQNQHDSAIFVIAFIGGQNEKTFNIANVLTNMLTKTAFEKFQHVSTNQNSGIKSNDYVSEGIYCWPTVIPIADSRKVLLLHANCIHQPLVDINPLTEFLDKVCHLMVWIQTQQKSARELDYDYDRPCETTTLTIASPKSATSRISNRSFDIGDVSGDTSNVEEFFRTQYPSFRIFVNTIFEQCSLVNASLYANVSDCQAFFIQTANHINFSKTHVVHHNRNQQECVSAPPTPKPRKRNARQNNDRAVAVNKENKQQFLDTLKENIISDSSAITPVIDESKQILSNAGTYTEFSGSSKNTDSFSGTCQQFTYVNQNDLEDFACISSVLKETSEIISGLVRKNSGRKLKERAQNRIDTPEIDTGQPKVTHSKNISSLEVSGGLAPKNWTPRVPGRTPRVLSYDIKHAGSSVPVLNDQQSKEIDFVHTDISNEEHLLGFKPEAPDKVFRFTRNKQTVRKFNFASKLSKSREISQIYNFSEFEKVDESTEISVSSKNTPMAATERAEISEGNQYRSYSIQDTKSLQDTSVPSTNMVPENWTPDDKQKPGSRKPFTPKTNRKAQSTWYLSQGGSSALTQTDTNDLSLTSKVANNEEITTRYRESHISVNLQSFSSVTDSTRSHSEIPINGDTADFVRFQRQGSSRPQIPKKKLSAKSSTDMSKDQPDEHALQSWSGKTLVTEQTPIPPKRFTSDSKTVENKCSQTITKEPPKPLQNCAIQSTRTSIVFYVSCSCVGVALANMSEIEPRFYPTVLTLKTNDEWMLGEEHKTNAKKTWNLSNIWDLQSYHSWKDKPVCWKGHDIEPTMEFLLSIILSLIKREFTVYLQDNHQKVLIAVPFWFTSLQRQQVLDAALLAGLKNANIVNENTSLAYYMFALEKVSSDEELVIISESHKTLDISVYEIKQFKTPFMLASSNPLFVRNTSGNKTDAFSKLDKAWRDITVNQIASQINKIRVLVSYESEALLQDIQKFGRSICKESLLSVRKETTLQGLFYKAQMQNQSNSSEVPLYDGASYSISVRAQEDKKFIKHFLRIATASISEQTMSCRILNKGFASYNVMQDLNSDEVWMAGTLKLLVDFSKSYDYTATFSYSADGIIHLREIEGRHKTKKNEPLEKLDSSKYKWTSSMLSEKTMKKFLQLLQQPVESQSKQNEIQPCSQLLPSQPSKEGRSKNIFERSFRKIIKWQKT